MKMGLKMPVALALVMTACSSRAGVTGLSSIPIADILGHREVSIGYSVKGNERNINRKIEHSSSVTIGIGDVAEVSYDDDLEQGQTTHFKVKLLEGSNYMFSAGVTNYEGKGMTADLFLVGRYDLKNCRLHFGYLKDTEHHGFVGVDFPLFGSCSGSLEWTSGPDARGWVSFGTPIKQIPGLSFSAGLGIPADRKTQGYQYTVGISYGFKL